MNMEIKSKKKFPFWQMIVVILIILFTGICCYFIFYQNFQKEKQPSDDTQEEEKLPDVSFPEPEETPIRNELAIELYNILMDYGNCGSNMLEYYQKDKVTIDDFSNEEKNRIIIDKMSKEYQPISEKSFTKDQILEVKNRLFGEKTSFEIPETYESGCKIFYKKKNDNKYYVTDECGGAMCSPEFAGEIIKAVQVGDLVYLDQRVVFGTVLPLDLEEYYSPISFYQDPEQTIFLGKKELKNHDNTVRSNINGILDTSDFQEQARVYRFTFQKNGEDYAFVQMERIQ